MFSLHKLKFSKIEKNITKTNIDLVICHPDHYQPISLQQIIQEARANLKPLLFVHVHWLLAENDKLHLSSSGSSKITGINKILTSFNEFAHDFKGTIYVVTKMSSNQLSGKAGLLFNNKISNLSMISDNEVWEKTFAIPTIKLDQKTYLKPFSLIVFPDGHAKAFAMTTPITEQSLGQHKQLLLDYQAAWQFDQNQKVKKMMTKA